ncbi:MAG: hypothetical protein E6Q97_09775 [Desulfurellales bacterium]|nr:MAG: hypothetical protein E6Q97_09775 [Desulfurellales bacterium]
MCERVGKRFAGCTFATYEIGQDKYRTRRQRVKTVVENYARSLREHHEAGTNLVIMGPKGTGKDHLAVSVVRVALGLGINVEYIRGSALYTEMRRHYCEHSAAVPQKFATVPFLVISDIEPTSDDKLISVFEERALLELIDLRWRECLPTIVTSNLESREQFDKKIGPRATDRLFDKAIVVLTCWPTERGPL